LERGAFSQDNVKEWGKKYVLFCHITTHIKGEKYGDLLTQKGGNGFPHLVFMDADGNVLATHEGDRSLEAFDETAKKAQKGLELRKKAASGDKAALVEVTLMDLEEGHIKLAEAKKKLEGVTLTDEQKKKFAGAEANEDVKAIIEPYDKNPPQTQQDMEKARREVGEKFAARKKAGKAAPTGEQEWNVYWSLLMGYAEEKKDAALYSDCLDAFKEKYGKEPRAKQALENMQKKLEEMKKGSGDEKKDEGK